jgi:transcriptional regulator with XRE-family HTH domain
MPSPEVACIQGLRSDVALQIARCLRGRGLSQLAVAKRLGVPQPTLSKIMNGRVADLSLELLLRIAVRLGLPLVLQTGRVPTEAGAYLSPGFGPPTRRSGSKLANAARDSLHEGLRHLTLEQRLDAFLEHNQLVSELHEAGRAAEKARLNPGTPQ